MKVKAPLPLPLLRLLFLTLLSNPNRNDNHNHNHNCRNPSLLVVSAFSVPSGQRTRSLRPQPQPQPRPQPQPSCVQIPSFTRTFTFAKNNNEDDVVNPCKYRRTSDHKVKFSNIENYLCKNATAVELPKMYKGDKTYCPLILDGASGVGKTQQAFALLKDGKERLVYVLMTPDNEQNQQNIYDEMRDFTKMDQDLPRRWPWRKKIRSFLDLLDAAMEQAEGIAEEEGYGQDAFAPKFIAKNLLDEPGYIAKLKEFLSKRVITYSPGDSNESETLEIKEHNSLESIRSVSLENVVLFVDEALPPKGTVYDTNRNLNRDVVYNRLCFLRSFGRAIGMRTVLAGTAATAANINMWAIPRAPSSGVYSSSRIDQKNVLWAEVEFLDPHLNYTIQMRQNERQTTTEDSNEDETVGDVVPVRVRPLLKTWLQDKPPFDSIRDVIGKINVKIRNSKTIPDKSKVIWLSGAWLDSPRRSPSPFQLKSAEIVRSNFFEPAISMDTEERFVYLGQGIDDIKRRQGPLQLRLFKREDRQSTGLVWALVVVDKDHGHDHNAPPLAVGVSKHFKNIEYGLSHCVQQCLAKEPLLAVSLSVRQHLETKAFQPAIAEAFPETEAQAAKGALDGKLHELVMFAALQLACRKTVNKNLSTNTVRDFIAKLHEYLQITAKEDRQKLLQNFDNDFTIDEIEVEESKIEPIYKRPESKDEGSNGNDIDDSAVVAANDKSQPHGGVNLDTIRLPWLVPACSKEALQEAHGKYGRLFTKDLNIAGLVPGTNDSRMDAEAYIWGESLEKDWGFEFKCQSAYTLEKGCDDLVQKCQVENDDNSNNDEKETIACHAMLIGISGKSESGCQWWVEKGEYLRVVLVVNNSPY